MAKIFSIKERFSQRIYANKKLVEFRRQNVNVKQNEVCLIYTSAPTKMITGFFIVKEKIRTNIRKLWTLTRNLAGISYSEFCEYFKGCSYGTAIIFKKIKKFSRSFTLDRLRQYGLNRPPQSYCNIDEYALKRIQKELDQTVLKLYV